MLTDSLTIGMASFLTALVAALALRGAGARPAVVWAAGVGCGFVAGLVAIERHAGWWAGIIDLTQPQLGGDWLPLAVLFAVGVTILAAHTESEWRPIIVVLGVVVTIVVVARLFAGHTAQQWSPAEKALWLVILSAALAAVWAMLSSARTEEQPRTRLALFVVVALSATVAITMSGSFTYGQMCGAVGAALVGTALANTGNASGISGAGGALTLSLGSVILLSNSYAKLGAFDAMLLLTALALAGGRLPAFVMQWGGWQQVALRVAVCLAPLVVVLVRIAGSYSADPY